MVCAIGMVCSIAALTISAKGGVSASLMRNSPFDRLEHPGLTSGSAECLGQVRYWHCANTGTAKPPAVGGYHGESRPPLPRPTGRSKPYPGSDKTVLPKGTPPWHGQY